MSNQHPTKPDWSKIRAYYESSGEPLRQVAERFEVSERTLFRRSAKEAWKNGSSVGTEDPENGSSTPIAAKNEPSEMAPLPENGSTDGSNVVKSGSNGGSTASKNGSATIPADINSLDRLAAAQFYFNTLGWAIHPLYAPDRGDPKERGKKPIFKSWRQHTAVDITTDDLAKCFCPGAKHNIGCVVRPPFVHVDLDSKTDAGASVMEWLATMPELAAVPRERTGGGVHLAFICRDIPEALLNPKQAPTCKINDKVNAELYLNGLNLVLSPSVHKSGHQYNWEVTGDIPEVKWADLCRWFGFATPELKKRGRPPKELPWWFDWPEDLRTLDLTKVLDGFGMLGECLSADEQKWAVRCPWESEHSGGANDTPGRTPSSSTTRKPCRASAACTPTVPNARSRTSWNGSMSANRVWLPPTAVRCAPGIRGKTAWEAAGASFCQAWAAPIRSSARRPVPISARASCGSARATMFARSPCAASPRM